jgi:hypothetical protein
MGVVQFAHRRTGEHLHGRRGKHLIWRGERWGAYNAFDNARRSSTNAVISFKANGANWQAGNLMTADPSRKVEIGIRFRF